MQLVMDDRGSQGPSHRRRGSGMRESTKSKAPSPPVLTSLDSPGFSQKYPGYPHLTMDQNENQDVSLVVVLPGGAEKTTTVPCSKPLMDLLVMLCAKYHLNPSSHTLELVTTNRNHVKFKPNALIGTLEAEKILLKPKGMEDKNKKSSPQMPEATVRMVINYRKTQKTILRVNPRVPLSEHLPAICEKCEFDVQTTVLSRDVQSQGPLDLSNSLNDYAIREVYARDKDQPPSPVCPASPTLSDLVTPGKDKTQKEKENKGLFSMFRRSKKTSEQGMTASAPASPVLVSKPRPLSMALPSTNSSPFISSAAVPIDTPKKRRAPQPPVLVSQSCPSDLSPRQRLNSEATEAQSDSDQKSGISRGSSAESSLKRTKRKAPPPPVVVQDNPLNGSSQESPANNTLEEIMEQEESAASIVSGTVSDVQGDDSSLNLSADVSLDQDAEKLSLPPVEVTREDPSSDLSSDGKYELKPMESTANDFVAHNNPRLSADMDLSEPADSESGPCQVEEVIQQPACEECPTEMVEGECSAVRRGSPSLPAEPATQGAETRASVQANTETPGEETDRFESPVANGTPRPHGEDAQVQTDLTPLPEPPRQDVDKVLPSAQPAATASMGQKKDMATFTEDLNPPDLNPALSHTPDTSACQASTPSPLAATKAPSIYAPDAEPKPKPSNELTRDYIPKVGMTTYTIVPQKSLEKLRYYEVELTLESPPPPAAAPEKELDIVSLHLEDGAAQQEQPEVPMQQAPREDSLMSDTTTISTTTSQSTVNGSMTEPIHSPLTPTGLPATDDKVSSPTNGGNQAGLTTEGKEMKIPPATKPKPGSFRLAQHKRTPGYYVTSAAEKRLSATPGADQREAPGSLERENLPPPPPPPPVQFPEEPVGGTRVELSPKEDDKMNVPTMRLARQSSLPSKEPTLGLSLEKLRSFAAPRPYSPSTPSRFAQAVSSAVKRTNSLSYGPRSPQSPVSPTFSPMAGRFSMKESKGSKESDNGEEDEEDKASTLQGGAEEPSAPGGIVQPAGDTP